MRKLTTFHYVDIHSHILYGVDDGPDNIETSIEMMKIAYDEGIRKIVATPHYHPGKCDTNSCAEILNCLKNR